MSAGMITALRTAIAASGSFYTAMGSRVYLDKAPSDSALPLCVYSYTVERMDKMASGRDHIASVVFQMFCSADSTATVASAQAALRTYLDGRVLTGTGYDRIVCQMRKQGAPVLDDDAWMIEDEYELRGNLA